MSRFEQLVKNGFCLGCGLCESLGGDKGYALSLKNNGFYGINLPERRDYLFEDRMADICPAITIQGVGAKNVWGPFSSITKVHSLDDAIRYKASSGGFVTELCRYMLLTKRIDGILHVGIDESNLFRNKLSVSRSVEAIIDKASSRYAPAVMFSELKQILDESNDRFLFVGKSCDILGIDNFLYKFPKYRNRIVLKVAIFCAGMPSYNATERLIALSGNNNEVKSIRYRGQGWPGVFSVDFESGEQFTIPYSESWNKYLGPALHYRCKICPDSVGTIADFSVGDAWELENGKTVFKEKPGESSVLVRTQRASFVFSDMIADGCIESTPMSESYLDAIQPNHVRKRTSSAYKLAAISILFPGLMRVNHMKLYHLALKYSFIKGCRDMFGAIKRLRKWKKQ